MLAKRLDELEIFHPERIAKRILGMGDIVSLVEKATKNFDEKKKDTEAQLKEGIFTMENYLSTKTNEKNGWHGKCDVYVAWS